VKYVSPNKVVIFQNMGAHRYQFNIELILSRFPFQLL